VTVTPEMAEDSAFNIEALLAEIAAETMGNDVDAECIANGDGDRRPVAILDAGNSVATVSTLASAAWSYDGIIDLLFGGSGLPAQYRSGASLLIGADGYAEILKLSDGSARPLLNPYTNAESLFGYPLEISEWMPTIGASARVGVFGNFSHYGIAQRTEFRVQRYDERYGPSIGYMFRARMGGDVLRPAAFKIALTDA